MRWVRTRVLPDPAPARLRSGPSPYVTASRWGSLSPSSRESRSSAAVLSAMALDDSGQPGVGRRAERLLVRGRVGEGRLVRAALAELERQRGRVHPQLVD